MIARIFAQVFLLLLPLGRFPSLNRIAFTLLGVNIGSDSKVYSSVRVATAIDLRIGNSTFVGHKTSFTGGKGSRIIIGDFCDISDHVHFVTGTHKIDSIGPRTASFGYSENIIVGDGVWIGYGALILPGVVIGRKALIAAGTVVHKDVPEFTLVSGNPMSIIRKL